MRTMPTPSCSTRPLPAVHAAALELDLLSSRWLVDIQCSAVPKSQRAAESAVIAIELASAGHRRKHHVRRAQESAVVCQAAFRLLFARGMLDVRTYDEARRRVDQLLAGLDAVSAAPDKDCASVGLPSLEPEAEDQN